MNNPKKVFLYYLSNVKRILEENDNVDSHLKHQLTDTMFPAHQHISTAVSFTLRCCCQLASREVWSIHFFVLFKTKSIWILVYLIKISFT